MRILQCGLQRLELGRKTHVMGVLNVTPDSFSDGGDYLSPDAAAAHAIAMLESGADVIDIGGESTRPFATRVTVAEELERVLPVVRRLVSQGVSQMSIDTRNAETARICLSEGVSWLNDVSGCTHDPAMFDVAAGADVFVLMHTRCDPIDMQRGEIHYDNVVINVHDFLARQVKRLIDSGVQARRILVDPGIGFGKHLEHNIALTRALSCFRDLGVGTLYGPSRKCFIKEITGILDPKERDAASLGAVAMAVTQGVDVVRVHDVKGTVDMLKVMDKLWRREAKYDENLYEARG